MFENRKIKIKRPVIYILFLIYVCVVGVWLGEKDLSDQKTVFEDYSEICSTLSDTTQCLLCGDNPQSMIPYYRQFDTVGLISLNDWYTIDLAPQRERGSGTEELLPGSFMGQINTGRLQIFADCLSSGYRTDVQVTWEEGLTLDATLIEENLCQKCLTKILDSLTVAEESHKKQYLLPFCLVDFRTLDLYLLQDWRAEYCIQDFWINLQCFDNGMEIRTFHLNSSELSGYRLT